MSKNIYSVFFFALLSMSGTLHANPLVSNGEADLTLESLAQAVHQLHLNHYALERFSLAKQVSNLVAQATLLGKPREDGTAYIMKYNEGGAVQSPECMNLSVGLLSSAPIAVNTFSTCVKLYDDQDCRGANFITDENGSYDNLKSIGPC